MPRISSPTRVRSFNRSRAVQLSRRLSRRSGSVGPLFKDALCSNVARPNDWSEDPAALPNNCVDEDTELSDEDNERSALMSLPERLQQQLHWLEDLLSRMTVCASIMFVAGSFDFLPDVRRDETRRGCLLFLVGNTVYLAAAVFDLEEAITARAGGFELLMNWLFVTGSAAYVTATFFYLPETSARLEGAEILGSIGFIVGSIFFVLGCFLNGAQASITSHRPCGPPPTPFAKHVGVAASIANFIGSQSFLVASILFFPSGGDCHGDKATRNLATYLFVIGSLFFTFAAFMPIVRRNFSYSSSLPFKRSCCSLSRKVFFWADRLGALHGDYDDDDSQRDQALSPLRRLEIVLKSKFLPHLQSCFSGLRLGDFILEPARRYSVSPSLSRRASAATSSTAATASSSS